jgi:signal peptidase I
MTKPKPTPPPEKETTLQSIAGMAAVLVIALFIMTFNVQAFEIPSSSMENTLLIGDHTFIDRVTKAPPTAWASRLIPYRDVRRGDIIVFFSPAEQNKTLVKRIIAVPGDRLHLDHGTVYINGVAQTEPNVIRSVGNVDPYRDNFPNVTATDLSGATVEWRLSVRSYINGNDLVVPPDSYFAMGDNRDVSWDSRYWGFVPRQNVLGRPLFVYWSIDMPDSMQAVDPAHPTGAERAKSLAYTVVHFFDRTRWRRTFYVPR